ncbi:hypothetical protein GCM10027418_10700 [Mariniluteicoccus endophyticus]
MPGLFDRLRRLGAVEAAPARPPEPDPDAQPVRSCTDRSVVTVRGELRSVTPSLEAEAPRLVAELDDGSGSVTIIWMGRRTIGGIAVGSILEVEGRVSCNGTVRKIYNPRYRLLRMDA